ncbi:hypothetical protein D2Q93_14720 [Alicyclobacillaceae bacterium I2511]|nr:hypothetical protein D2Q93_14720 [Alicyclobacillaceae bacterium I2511]
MRTGNLRYDVQTSHWVFENQKEGCHSGEALEFKIGNRYVYGRLEFKTDWYVIFSDARFFLMPEWVYPVRIV